ncbi:universal stress protein [Caldimonas brevitalea]|uniref:Universal stress protein n=1 Tax=Caldimonas brevitalea TaxID=413882 RepID=A0A0G3BL59_9BURK|nr:universal stress protein [Caldimonas brevitalea]AKJ28106.1 universal stress protein UspA [Caldimonas brevitalea]
MYKRILVPTDGSDITQRAITTAISLAKLTGAEVFTISVKDPYPYSAISEMQPTLPQEFLDAQERVASRNVAAVKEACLAVGIPCTAHTVESVSVWEAVVDYAKQHGCDLIVMASHGRRGVQALLLGSETNRVLTHSTIPVLVVR